jgi:predicted ATPase/class 3 adenylate cyclase
MGAPSGTVTFLFTDIEGSTGLWEAAPDAMRVALERHDSILRSAIEGHDGYVFSTGGDGFAAAFARAGDGVAAAVRAQEALAVERWPVGTEIRVRMGLHTGEVEERGEDYFGSAVNRAARLMAVAHGKQIVCSSATAGVLDAGVVLVDLGEHRLRDLDQPMRVFQLGGAKFPALRSLDAFPGNLPVQVSSFVGRERQIERTAAALADSRVVTLTGVGGVGKTRLAVQVAAEVLPRFRDGAWLVELAPIREAAGVVGALAAVFGVVERRELTLVQSLIEFLRTKQLLVLLDNCEHLLEPVAEVVESLELECPGVVILATSREGLAIEGERVLPVPSLQAPAPDASPDAAGESDAVRLFVERARSVDPDFSLTLENAPAVVQICRRLDGVALAIELAAARVVAMSPAELAQGLERRFDTLSARRRRVVERHQTLRAAIDWSYDLLSDEERRLLARLAIFAGGWNRQAAEAVCGGEPLVRTQVFDLLAALVTKSLVVAQRDGPETRYRLLETILEYGEERLAEYVEIEDLNAGHAEYFCALGLELSEELYGPNQVAAAGRLSTEQENLLAAMNYAMETENVDLALRLVNSNAFPGIDQALNFPIDALLRLPGATDHAHYPLALAVAAMGAAARGDPARAQQACDEALAAAPNLDADPRGTVELIVANARGALAIAAGAWDEAALHHEHGAQLARSTERRDFGANHFASAAIDHTMAGDPDAAERLASEGLDLARQARAPLFIASNLVALAGALADRDPLRARNLLKESLELRSTFQTPYAATQTTLIAARIADWSLVCALAPDAIRRHHWAGDRPYLIGVLNIVARALAESDPSSAAVLQGAARGLVPTEVRIPDPGNTARSAAQHQGGPPNTTGFFLTSLRRETSAIIGEALGKESLYELRAEGQSMDYDHVVSYALDAIARAKVDQQTGR